MERRLRAGSAVTIMGSGRKFGHNPALKVVWEEEQKLELLLRQLFKKKTSYYCNLCPYLEEIKVVVGFEFLFRNWNLFPMLACVVSMC